MIYDCFMFYNELDLLEIRLNSLAPFVDKFVLVESTTTHSGKPKTLFFKKNEVRFAEFPIIHIVADPPTELDRIQSEAYQRDELMRGLVDAGPEDTILVSDVDEIPDLRGYDGREGLFVERTFYYYLNVLHQLGQNTTIALKSKNLSHPTAQRQSMRSVGPVIGSGWHYSYLGGAANIKNKLGAFCHGEYDTPEYKAAIPKQLSELKDPFGRLPDPFPIIDLEGPEWLLANQDKYKSYIKDKLGREETIFQATQTAMQSPGFMFRDELEWLATQAYGKKLIVEIGTWAGRSTKAMAMACAGTVYSVDDYSHSFINGAHVPDTVRNLMRSNLGQQIGLGKVVQMDMHSLEAAPILRKQLGDGSVHMVFVDGDHRGTCAEQDINAYLPLLKPDGFLCGHDIQDPPVRECLNRMMPNWLPGPNLLWYRPGGEV